MYPSVAKIIDMAQKRDETRPVVMCEYAHAMGNSNGNLKEYWEAVAAHKRLQGGFIWDWVDQGLRRYTDSGEMWFAYGGDYGDEPNDYNFCLNGLVSPDREPHPGLWEYKKVLQPLRVEAVDLASGKVAVENGYHFSDLSHLAIRWSVSAEGEIVQSGTLPSMPTPAGEREVVTVPFNRVDPQPQTEYWLQLSFHLADATPWAEAGHEVAWAQFQLPISERKVTPPDPTDATLPPLSLTEAGSTATITGQDFQLVLDKARGRLTSFKHLDQELLVDGPRPNFWRAPTDNDANTWGDQRMAIRWRAAGLDQLVETIEKVQVSQGNDRAVTITVRSVWEAKETTPVPNDIPEEAFSQGIAMTSTYLKETQLRDLATKLGINYNDLPGQEKAGKLNEIVNRAKRHGRLAEIIGLVYEYLDQSSENVPQVLMDALKDLADQPESGGEAITYPPARFECEMIYTVYGSGDLVIETHLAPSEELPPLPRIGLTMTVPGRYNTFTWYGPGPRETYADRKLGAKIGRYSGSVDDQYFPYIMPQENGNKTDVRWASLTDDEGFGLMAVGLPLLNASAHHFTAQDLTEAQHTYQLSRREDITLNLDYAQGGLGNGSCGPGVLDQYLLQPQPQHYRVWLRASNLRGD
jgi:beta-galactosidase/beta-glucuronidase